jgi:hypothetical protein
MFAIRAYVGPNGGGKTLAMIESQAVRSWERGRPVVANLQLYPERLGFSADLFEPLITWRQIPDLAGCTLLLDEISSVLPSRQAMSVPPQLVRILNQLRKGDVDLGWTAPNWARCDVLLREVTQAVTVCRSSFPDRWQREQEQRMFPRARRNETGGRLAYEAGWLPNRLFTFTTYDALEFDEFTYAAVKDVKPRAVQRYWRSRHLAHTAYGTLDAVGLLDHLDDVGVCVICGGQRKRPQCKCTIPAQAAGPHGPEAEADQHEYVIDPRKPHGPITPQPRRQRVRVSA